MDKETLSNYGWIVICVLILAVLLALASPFGTFIADAVKSTTQSLFDVNRIAMNSTGLIDISDNIIYRVEYTMIEGAGQTLVDNMDGRFRSDAPYDKFVSVSIDGNIIDSSNYNSSEGSTVIVLKNSYIATLKNGLHKMAINSTDGQAICDFSVSIEKQESIDMSTVDSTLENNNWDLIQKVAQAGKVEEAGWKVGDSKAVVINGQTLTAVIIGINHDSDNSITFMVTNYIGQHKFNNTKTNVGGWEASDMRNWLNNDVYNGLDETLQTSIKEVSKMTNNVGNGDKTATATVTNDKLFLLSVSEIGKTSTCDIDGEGEMYEWFRANSLDSKMFWLRSPRVDSNANFCDNYRGNIGSNYASYLYNVITAFVIG